MLLCYVFVFKTTKTNPSYFHTLHNSVSISKVIIPTAHKNGVFQLLLGVKNSKNTKCWSNSSSYTKVRNRHDFPLMYNSSVINYCDHATSP